MNHIEKLRHHKTKEPRVPKVKRKQWALARAAKRYAGPPPR
jgi:hypothetical protein